VLEIQFKIVPVPKHRAMNTRAADVEAERNALQTSALGVFAQLNAPVDLHPGKEFQLPIG
jgi:hypothetical protein